MMNRLLQIAILALAWPQLVAPASAVSVPQTSASDYIFSRPLHTNHIKGVLVDPDPTKAYRVIRSEDVDWLLEAFSERSAIFSGRIGRPWQGVGSLVRRSDLSLDIIGYDWLDADATLLSGTRLIPGSLATTNTYVQKMYTNVWTNAFAVITMPMTNGTVSVHTNSWRVQKRVPVESVATNVHGWTDVDFCHGVDGVPFPVYSNATAFSWASLDETYASFPNVKAIGHAREILRGTKRLADGDGLWWTNETRTISESLSDGGTPSVSTSMTGSCIFEFHAGHTYAEKNQTDQFAAVIPTRFSSSLVTTGGANRVSVEAAFARCVFYYYHFSGNTMDTHIYTNAVVRLGEPSLDLSGNNALCRVSISARGLCSACASAAGAPYPPESVTYRTSEGDDAFWGVDVDNIVLFYSITPSVKLPDW